MPELNGMGTKMAAEIGEGDDDKETLGRVELGDWGAKAALGTAESDSSNETETRREQSIDGSGSGGQRWAGS